MLIRYNAIDGYKLSDGSTGAWLMADVAADMVNDRMGNSPLKDLTINGSITTAVAAANSTTLVASGFSASNYYSLAYDAALDPGTTGLSAKIWFKTPIGISVGEEFFERRDNGSPIGTGPGYNVSISSVGIASATVRDGTSVRTIASTSSYDDAIQHMLSFDFDGTTIRLYIDGSFIGSTTGTALNTLDNANAVLTIGQGVFGFPTTTSSIAGLEIEIGTQWNAQEHKTKYEKEKVLFQPLELFSIVGNELEYEENLFTASIGHTINASFNETLNASRSGFTWSSKQVMNCSTVPFVRASLPGALKFLKSTVNVPFTYDERGSTANSPKDDNPISVYKTSNNEQIQFNNPDYQFSFSVRAE